MKTGGYARKFVDLLGAALVVALLFGTVPSASAKDYRAECRQRIEKAELKLDKAIREHGLYSHQAQEQQRDLRSERKRCWSREGAWWDGRSQSWRTDADWDQDDLRDHARR